MPFGPRSGAKSLAQALGDLFVQGGRHDAADVVGFENRRGDLHGDKEVKRIENQREADPDILTPL